MSQEEAHAPRARLSPVAALGYGLLCALLGVGALLGVRQARTTARARALDAELLAHEARLRARRFDRPAVVETPTAGACDSVLDAVDALRGLDLGDDALRRFPFGSTLTRGTAAPPEVASLVRRNSALLDALGRCAACPRVRVSGALRLSDPGPEYVRLLRGVYLAALRDRDGDPARCLDGVVRSARLLSDLPYAAGYLGLAIQAAALEPLTLVALRCARRADSAVVTDAWRRLSTVAALPLPEGEALVFERLSMARPIRDEVFRTPVFPTTGEDLNAWALRPRLVEGWASLTDDLETLPTRTTSPAEAELRVEEQDSILRRMSSAFASGPSAQRFLHRGRAGHAWLRLLTVSLDAIARASSAPPPGPLAMPQLAAPWARDPFTHRDALRWARNHSGAFIAWSVGPDGLDGHGSGDDILLTVPGAPGEPEHQHNHQHGHGHEQGAPSVPGLAP